MPYIIQGNHVSQRRLTPDVKYEYDYPEDLKLSPHDELHKKLVDRLCARVRTSQTAMADRHDSWKDVDHVLTAYRETTEAEEKIKNEDSRKPVSLVIPFSYVILDTVVSYMVSAFLQEPVFRYEGRSPEDLIGALLMEKVIQAQVYQKKIGLALYTVFRDSFAYGIAGACVNWEVEEFMRTRRTTLIDPTTLQPYKGVMRETMLAEGNSVTAIDPYQYIPDPSVPVHESQKGEFQGFYIRENLTALLSRERMSDGEIFNVKYLKHLKGQKTTLFNKDQSGRYDRTGLGPAEKDEEGVTSMFDVVYMYVDLIPAEWELGSSEYPEKWEFVLVADTVLIKASKIEYDHGMFPIAMAAPDYDGHSVAPTSKVEMLYGMQMAADWMLNAHVDNVRKSLQDMFIVDPFSIVMDDIKKPGPGKLIRTRRPLWGKGVEGVVKQFPVTDVTRGHVADTTLMLDWMTKIGGADESMMGALRNRGPERLTGTEFQGTRSGAVSRLEKAAYLIGLQFMRDVGLMMALNTQQFMTEETYIKITGDWPEDIRRTVGASRGDRLRVTPFDISVDFDVVIRDGSVPGSNFSDQWVQLFQMISSNELLAQKFDVPRIFEHIARNLGAKNVSDFVRENVGQAEGANVTIMPDEQIMQQAQAGNIVPVGT